MLEGWLRLLRRVLERIPPSRFNLLRACLPIPALVVALGILRTRSLHHGPSLLLWGAACGALLFAVTRPKPEARGESASSAASRPVADDPPVRRETPRLRLLAAGRGIGPWLVFVGVPVLFLVLNYAPGTFWLLPDRTTRAPGSAGWGVLLAVAALATVGLVAVGAVLAAAASRYDLALQRTTAMAAVCLGLGIVAVRPSLYPVPGIYSLARAATRAVTPPVPGRTGTLPRSAPTIAPADPEHDGWKGRPSVASMGRRQRNVRLAAALGGLWGVGFAFVAGLARGLWGPGAPLAAAGLTEMNDGSVGPADGPGSAAARSISQHVAGSALRGWAGVARVFFACIIALLGFLVLVLFSSSHAFGAPLDGAPAAASVVTDSAVPSPTAESTRAAAFRRWHRTHRDPYAGAYGACGEPPVSGEPSERASVGPQARPVQSVGEPSAIRRAVQWGDTLRFEAVLPLSPQADPNAAQPPLAWNVAHGSVAESGMQGNVAWAHVHIEPDAGEQDDAYDIDDDDYHAVEVQLTRGAGGPADTARWCIAAGNRIPFAEALRRCLPSSTGGADEDGTAAALALAPEVARARLAHVGELPIAERRAALVCFRDLRGREALHSDHADYLSAYRLLERRVYPPGPEARWWPQSAVEARILLRAGMGRLLLGLGLAGFVWRLGVAIGAWLRDARRA